MKGIKKAIIFVLALTLVLGLMTVSAFAVTHNHTESKYNYNFANNYSHTTYGDLYCYYTAPVTDYTSPWAWTVLDTINSDTSYSASVELLCEGGPVHSKTSITRNSQNRVSTGTCYGDMGIIADYVIHTGSRTTLNDDIEYYRYSVY